MPFEEDFIAGVVDDVKAKLEKAIWQGDTSNGDTNLNKFDGFIKIADAAHLAGTYTIQTSDSVSKVVSEVYKLIPSATYEKGEVVMFMGYDNYRVYIQELIANVVNDVAMPASVLIPGTNVRVIPVAGLDGTGRVFASYRDNFVYGTDMAGDNEVFDFWYSKDNLEYRLNIEFSAGTQFCFPDLLAMAKKA